MLRLGAKANEWVGMGRLIYAGLAAGYGGGASATCVSKTAGSATLGYGNARGRTSSPTGQRHRLWTSDPWGMTLEGCAISLCLVPERHKACPAVVLLEIGARMRAENRQPSARGALLVPEFGAGCCMTAFGRPGGSGRVVSSMQGGVGGRRGAVRHLCLENR